MNQVNQREITIKRLHPEWKLLRRNPKAFADQADFAVLAEQFPEFLKYDDTLEVKLPVDNPILTEVLDAVKRLGLTIQSHRADYTSQVLIRDYHERRGTPEEIASSKLFECKIYNRLIAWGEAEPEESPNLLTIQRSLELRNNASKEWGALTNRYHLLVVRGETRQFIEESGLNGLSLIELPCDKGWPPAIEPLYLIWSNETLITPVRQLLYDDKGNVFHSDERNYESLESGCYLLDGYEANPRLAYSTNPMGDLDVALTKERFGGKTRSYGKIVYSRKAVDVFTKSGIKFDIEPVVIDVDK
jgi:hypothetical protein